ncbi:hypothetical protein L218DRAFT_949317 [Marasmius fiardii PR-910]|nr:hypothetical protein L218DRAFT_949317 [Marasmius fiardii PR-910]
MQVKESKFCAVFTGMTLLQKLRVVLPAPLNKADPRKKPMEDAVLVSLVLRQTDTALSVSSFNRNRTEPEMEERGLRDKAWNSWTFWRAGSRRRVSAFSGLGVNRQGRPTDRLNSLIKKAMFRAAFDLDFSDNRQSSIIWIDHVLFRLQDRKSMPKYLRGPQTLRPLKFLHIRTPMEQQGIEGIHITEVDRERGSVFTAHGVYVVDQTQRRHRRRTVTSFREHVDDTNRNSNVVQLFNLNSNPDDLKKFSSPSFVDRKAVISGLSV